MYFFHYFYLHFSKMERKGKDARGIQLWVGKVDIPQRWVCNLLLLFGLIILEGTIQRLLRPLPGDGFEDTVFRVFRMFTGGVLTYSGIQMWILRRQLLRLRAADTVAAQLGLTDTQLQEMTRERSILPRYNVNGRDFYDLKDFGDAGTLLRGATAPGTPPEILLRAAENKNETEPQMLLRATVGEVNGESR